MGFFDKLKKGLNKTRENLTNKIEKIIIGYADIDDDLLDELEETLIMADVGVQTTDKLMTAVRKGIKKKEINTPEDLKPFLQKQIVEILTKGEAMDTTRVAENGPTVLLVIGVNGAGKTTTIGKLAAYCYGPGQIRAARRGAQCRHSHHRHGRPPADEIEPHAGAREDQPRHRPRNPRCAA